jgi:hypothetical protein
MNTLSLNHNDVTALNALAKQKTVAVADDEKLATIHAYEHLQRLGFAKVKRVYEYRLYTITAEGQQLYNLVQRYETS